MTAAIRVERAEQALRRDRFGQPEKARHRAFFFHQDCRINLAGRVVHRHHQVQLAQAAQPDVPRGVLMQHHAHHRPPVAFAPVRAAPWGLIDQAFPLQETFGPAVTPAETVVPRQIFVKMFRGQPLVAAAIQPRDFLLLLGRYRMPGTPAQAVVGQAALSLRLEPPRPTAEGSLAHPKYFGGFKLAQPPRFPTGHGVSKFQHPQALQLLRPAHPTLQRADPPDGSLATYAGQFTCYVHSSILPLAPIRSCAMIDRIVGFGGKVATMTQPDTTIFHNPKCGASRKVLGILRDAGREPHVIEYLETPPTRAELTALLAKLSIGPRALLRKKDAAYAQLDLGNPAHSDDVVIDGILAHPILMERPIVVAPIGARVCRPPERVRGLLG